MAASEHIAAVAMALHATGECTEGVNCESDDPAWWHQSDARGVLDSTDPAVHAAMLDALVRAGVLTREERKLCDGFAWTSVAPDGTVTSGGRPQTRQRRYVTEWTAE